MWCVIISISLCFFAAANVACNSPHALTHFIFSVATGVTRCYRRFGFCCYRSRSLSPRVSSPVCIPHPFPPWLTAFLLAAKRFAPAPLLLLTSDNLPLCLVSLSFLCLLLMLPVYSLTLLASFFAVVAFDLKYLCRSQYLLLTTDLTFHCCQSWDLLSLFFCWYSQQRPSLCSRYWSLLAVTLFSVTFGLTAGLVIRNRHTKINLLRGREGYDESETTYEKLSARRIQLCRGTSSIFIFWGIFEE